MLGGNGSAEDTLPCQVCSCRGRSLAAHVCSGGQEAAAAGREGSWVPDTGQDGPSAWPGAVYTPATAAAKAQAKGCPGPCPTTARPSLGLRFRAAGQNPPEDRLELIHHSRDYRGAQTARQRPAEVPAWGCRGQSAPRRGPTAGPRGGKALRLKARPNP